ncbi:putative aldouronate transport system permease protein [Paenibacillus sp. UNC496MF]|uniref:carbohydrate ABC transporter permease n=1 Tax=Paenibacillus sp. UNC496MF TaxID=1502753 RepID=UPI0008E89044|nr:carbohydrate ABC transporter permease [Paenibacillus sp. UNC496MF]SFI72575.1 putative aldouronate transport system permease protein [Paenibacillus sp. UNC496MF]
MADATLTNPSEHGERLANRGKSKADLLLHAIFIVLGICAVFPFYTVIITSFGTPKGMLLPTHFTLEGYKQIIEFGIGRAFVVSSLVTLTGTALSLTLTIIAAYALSKKAMPGRNVLMTIVIFTMFFGGGLIPYYLTVKGVGLYNSYLVMILPSAISTYYVWIMMSFFRDFPASLEESARIDGAGDLTILLRIVIPTSLPVLASISLFYAVDRWNDWYGPMLFLSDSDKYPLQLMLRNILMNISQILSKNVGMSAVDQSKINIPQEAMQMAAIVIASFPIMAVYPFLQKYFAKGVMVGSIKG